MSFVVVIIVQLLSYVRLFVTPWTVAHQVPLSVGFPRQEYWSKLSFPSPEDLPDPGIKPMSLVSPALAGGSFTTCATWEAPKMSRNRGKIIVCLDRGKIIVKFF